MSPEVRREIRTTPRFLDKVQRNFGEGFDGRPSAFDFLTTLLMPYVVEAFMQDWENLPLLFEDARVRFYDFKSEEVPHCIVVGELTAITATDPFYIVNVIDLVDLIVTFDERPLEDPDGQTPNR